MTFHYYVDRTETATTVRSEDVSTLMSHLYKNSYKWWDIGTSLNFQNGELENIKQSKPGAHPQQLLNELLSQWSQWPTVDHPEDPTMERLCDALRSGLVRLGATADHLFEIRNFLPSSN